MNEADSPAPSGADAAPPYAGLTPDVVLDAIEHAGMRPDGRLLALGSYENRVYQIGCEDNGFVVAKFYRPLRWSDAQIAEEHGFVSELVEAEVPVCAPVASDDGTTLHRHAGFRYALYPRRGGRPAELDQASVLRSIGTQLGRIHAVGAGRAFRHRLRLDVAAFGDEPRRFVLDHGFVPDDLRPAYESISALALDAVRRSFERAGEVRMLRVHGDCHGGNILWTDAGAQSGPLFIDFDDCCTAPAIQDLWMLLPGERSEQEGALRALVSGYREFADLERRELLLVEALRTLRLLHYAGWIARRWNDPAFPAAFTWFNTQRYWQDRILELREQVALMDEPALELPAR